MNYILRSFCATTAALLLLAIAAPGQAASPPAKLELTAESAVLMDGNGQVLYEKEAHKPLPPASVTKAMTLLLAVEAVEQGRAKLDDPVYTSENAWRQGGSQIWLEPGEKMTMKEVMTAVAVVSANDAAMALMEHLYGSEAAAVEAMNQRAAELGLQNTHFASVNGLPTPNHYMSAYDVALIAREALKHPLYMQLTGIKEYWLRDGKNWLVNTNKLLWWYKGADGLKTGWTQEAKYCFVGTAERDGLRLIGAVFAVPEPRGHLRETMKLFDWGFANYRAVPVVKQGDEFGQAQVVKGMERTVPLVAARDIVLTVPKGEVKGIETKIIMPDSIPAPVQYGQPYGVVVAVKNGQELDRADLVAATSVAKASFFHIFSHMMLNILSVQK